MTWHLGSKHMAGPLGGMDWARPLGSMYMGGLMSRHMTVACGQQAPGHRHHQLLTL